MMERARFFILLFTALTSANAEGLGRLIYTPQQRAQLEAQQQAGTASTEGVKRSYLMVNGLIQKQGGKRIVWVNGVQQAATSGNEKSPSTVPVTVPGKSQPVQLKVGQRLILNTVVEEKTDEAKPAPAKPVANEDD